MVDVRSGIGLVPGTLHSGLDPPGEDGVLLLKIRHGPIAGLIFRALYPILDFRLLSAVAKEEVVIQVRHELGGLTPPTRL